MKRALILAGLALAAAPSIAGAAGGGAEKKTEAGQFVGVSPVAVPVVVSGKVVNYVFVTVRIELSPSANAPKLREKEPFFRDALVRASHRTPFTLASDYTRIDEAKLKAAMMREAQAIAGPGQVRSIVLVSQQPKSLRVIAG